MLPGNMCAVLVNAPIARPRLKRGTSGQNTSRFIAGVLEEQSHDTMRGNSMRSKVARERSVVRVRPEVLFLTLKHIQRFF